MKIQSQKELRKQFWHLMFPYHKPKKGYKQNDYCTDVRVAWTDFVDSMNRDQQISDELAFRATL